MQSWSITDKGAVRQENQDTVFAVCDEESAMAFLVVCDGMGGARAGSIASRMAQRLFTAEMRDLLTGIPREKEIADAFSHAVRTVNDALFQKSCSDPDCRGMGTTIVAAAVTGETCVVVNVGDSRAYHITQERIHQITVDHSVIEDLIREGKVTREEARHMPGRNLITRALGTMPQVDEDIFTVALQEGEWLLLCSDGLSNVIGDTEMHRIICDYGDETGCQILLRLALERGAPDNLSAVLLRK